MVNERAEGTKLKRELGTLESYAVLVGILVGAGIFKVTSDATAVTGPSVILGHMVLAPIILATAVAYIVFLSTPLGRESGGEVLHISSTFRSRRLTFLAAWLKLISYFGAAAYLADALALNLLELFNPGAEHSPIAVTVVALLGMLTFLTIQVIGVRSFGRVQVAMCAILALSLAVLIVPGVFAINPSNYQPFFTGGVAGFGASLPSLFFAYAGFEALSQAAGEVRDSQSRLPRVFLRGILVTAIIFVLMSAVAIGALPANELGASGVPMSIAAATYLPFGAELVVTLGAVMAVATSLNATLFVPARLACHLSREGFLPKAFASLHATRRTPVFGLLISFTLAALLLLSGRMDLALGIAIVSLMLLYALHSIALVMFPRRCPELYKQRISNVPRWLQLTAAWCSILALGSLVLLRFSEDLSLMLEKPMGERLGMFELTSLELFTGWVVVGLVLFQWTHRNRK
ncbi:MAG: APA family basic amino acid/polyamine antiporter [Planctomycetota bacterium]|jgi:APA family basic amino acid/polyamine antiporter